MTRANGWIRMRGKGDQAISFQSTIQTGVAHRIFGLALGTIALPHYK
jgi:hypothetical protein